MRVRLDHRRTREFLVSLIRRHNVDRIPHGRPSASPSLANGSAVNPPAQSFRVGGVQLPVGNLALFVLKVEVETLHLLK
jgi:hypothetical protein